MYAICLDMEVRSLLSAHNTIAGPRVPCCQRLKLGLERGKLDKALASSLLDIIGQGLVAVDRLRSVARRENWLCNEIFAHRIG